MTPLRSRNRPDKGSCPKGQLALVILSFVAVSACQSEPVSTLPADPDSVVASGRDIYTSEGCVNCHGSRGEGEIGPQLNEGSVLETFGSCNDQLRWIELGSARWLIEVGASYGDPGKPVEGGMPTFGSRLDPDQIVAVAAFTRSAFGGAGVEEAVADCEGNRP